jgi:hypothetical protein
MPSLADGKKADSTALAKSILLQASPILVIGVTTCPVSYLCLSIFIIADYITLCSICECDIDIHELDGKGSLKTVMGVYEGDFKHGKKHGNGTMKWDNGARYKGEWENDMMHGKGEFTGVDGSVYNGEWREHRREGRGIFTSAQGWKYEGEWKDNERDGEGTMYYANGDVYIGQWKKNKVSIFAIVTSYLRFIYIILTSFCVILTSR